MNIIQSNGRFIKIYIQLKILSGVTLLKVTPSVNIYIDTPLCKKGTIIVPLYHYLLSICFKINSFTFSILDSNLKMSWKTIF